MFCYEHPFILFCLLDIGALLFSGHFPPKFPCLQFDQLLVATLHCWPTVFSVFLQKALEWGLGEQWLGMRTSTGGRGRRQLHSNVLVDCVLPRTR